LTSGLFSLPLAPADVADVAVREPLLAANESFVAGPENALIRTLAAAVEGSKLGYNPIVLCGGPGVGKSSLAHALAAIRRQRHNLTAVVETTGAALAQALAHAIDTASIGDLRSQYHRCDLLLIDDLHRLAGRPAAQQFLLSAVDALLRRGSLVLVTLPQPPQATASLTPALASRLAGGLVVKLAPPGALAARELMRREAERISLALDDEQIAQLSADAESAPTSATRLRRTVLRLAAETQFGRPHKLAGSPQATVDQAAEKAVCRQISIAVAKRFGLTLGELKSKSRRQAIVEARSLAMHLARRLTDASFAEIGRSFGNRDHTTVMHACRKAAETLLHDEFTRRAADDIAARISAEEQAAAEGVA
jgi:chromosomal replication initiator protein